MCWNLECSLVGRKRQYIFWSYYLWAHKLKSNYRKSVCMLMLFNIPLHFTASYLFLGKHENRVFWRWMNNWTYEESDSWVVWYHSMKRIQTDCSCKWDLHHIFLDGNQSYKWTLLYNCFQLHTNTTYLGQKIRTR